MKLITNVKVATNIWLFVQTVSTIPNKVLFELGLNYFLSPLYAVISRTACKVESYAVQVATMEIQSPFRQTERKRFPRLVDPRPRAPSQENCGKMLRSDEFSFSSSLYLFSLSISSR